MMCLEEGQYRAEMRDLGKCEAREEMRDRSERGWRDRE